MGWQERVFLFIGRECRARSFPIACRDIRGLRRSLYWLARLWWPMRFLRGRPGPPRGLESCSLDCPLTCYGEGRRLVSRKGWWGLRQRLRRCLEFFWRRRNPERRQAPEQELSGVVPLKQIESDNLCANAPAERRPGLESSRRDFRTARNKFRAPWTSRWRFQFCDP